MTVLEVKDLTGGYTRKPVIHDLDFSLDGIDLDFSFDLSDDLPSNRERTEKK